MAKLSFKQLPESQPSLFPENIYDKIPKNHPVRLIDKIVDNLDTKFILKTYKGGGNSAYPPKLMLKILFYAYLNNIYSSRKIAKALQENIHFMWLARHSTPNFRTINNFRGKRLKNQIHILFKEVVLMLNQMGLVSLKKQYVDGTKIEATSNRYTFVWKKSVEKNKEKLQNKLHNILQDIEQHIQIDNGENEINLPQEIDYNYLEKKISEINEILKDQEISKPLKKKINTLSRESERLKKYEKQLDILGERNSYSKTDTDATFMRMKDDHMKNGQLKPAYNIQISSENQIITHYSIYQSPTDTTCLIPHLEGFKSQYQFHSQEIIADAGYGSQENYEYLEQNNIIPYIKYNYFHKEQTRKYKNNAFLSSNLYYNEKDDYFICPMGQKMNKIKQGKRKTATGYEYQVSYYQAINCKSCPLRGQCHTSKENRIIEVNHQLNAYRKKARELLLSEEGLNHRSKRGIDVEPVFGQLKFNNNFTRFTLRGLEKVNIEFGLMAIGHNLRKLLAYIANNLFDFLKKHIFAQIKNLKKLIFVFFRKNKPQNLFFKLNFEIN